MDTDTLIAQLSSEPLVRKPLRSTVAVAFLWLSSAAVFVAAIGAYVGFRDDVGSLLSGIKGITEIVLLLISTVLSSYVALDLRYPQTPMLLKNKVLLGIVSIIWLSLAGVHAPAVALVDIHVVTGELSKIVHQCVLELCAISLIPVVYIAYLSKKGATTNKAATGFACVIAAASLGALLMRLLCPDDNHLHLFLWHFMPVIVLAGAGMALGRVLFRW